MKLPAALSVAILSACSGAVDYDWSEEVTLDDGTVVTVTRHVEAIQSNSLAGDAYSSRDISSTIRFLGAHSSLPTWDYPLQPLVLYLDRDANQWVVVATAHTCEFWYDHGMPKPPYWEYRLRYDRWSEVPLSSSSHGRRTNFFILHERGIPAPMVKKSMKDELMKKELVGASSRSILADAKSNCG